MYALLAVLQLLAVLWGAWSSLVEGDRNRPTGAVRRRGHKKLPRRRTFSLSALFAVMTAAAAMFAFVGGSIVALCGFVLLPLLALLVGHLILRSNRRPQRGAVAGHGQQAEALAAAWVESTRPRPARS